MILVTGGQGYVGSFTLRLFKKGKHFQLIIILEEIILLKNFQKTF